MPNGGLNRPLVREPHQTGEPWHLSCHGGKTPAKLHVPRAVPRPTGAVWGAGVLPLLDGEGFVFAEKGGVFGEEGTDEVGKELVHLLGAAARVESRIK